MITEPPPTALERKINFFVFVTLFKIFCYVQAPNSSLFSPKIQLFLCSNQCNMMISFNPLLPFSQQGLAFFFSFLGLPLRHMEVARLGVKSELQLPVYITATATQDPSHVCNLYHRSWQHWILNLLSEDRDQTCILMDTNWVCNPLCHNRNSKTGVYRQKGLSSSPVLSL